MNRAASAKNVSFISRCDQGGRPDGVQVIVHKGHAYIGHMFSDGYSVVDVRDPPHPKTVAFVATPPERIVEQRPGPARVILSCDVFVDKEGLMYLTDTNAGLNILQYEGH